MTSTPQQIARATELAAEYAQDLADLRATDTTGWSRRERREHEQEIADLERAVALWEARARGETPCPEC